MDTKSEVKSMSSKKMGRPPSDNPKSELIRVRVDQEILSKLDACTEKLQTTRSDVIRKGIEKVFDELQK
ncbi:CopG family transcriptional regulator [Paenibacillus silagei]|nr:CopG family transcriptional regulator [Paenibacillus silagei]